MPGPKLSNFARRFWLPLFFVALLNFFVFGYVAQEIGGDALSGNSENGQYFVSNHGVKTEVSKAVYCYSYIHTVSMIITHTLVLGSALVLLACGKLYEKPTSDALH